MNKQVKFKQIIEGTFFQNNSENFIKLRVDENEQYNAVCLSGEHQGKTFLFFGNSEVLSVNGEFQIYNRMSKRPE